MKYFQALLWGFAGLFLLSVPHADAQAAVAGRRTLLGVYGNATRASSPDGFDLNGFQAGGYLQSKWNRGLEVRGNMMRWGNYQLREYWATIGPRFRVWETENGRWSAAVAPLVGYGHGRYYPDPEPGQSAQTSPTGGYGLVIAVHGTLQRDLNSHLSVNVLDLEYGGIQMKYLTTMASVSAGLTYHF